VRVTTVINQKGGVGKTTTAHALAAGLKNHNKRVLCVDTDPQGNLSYTMQVQPTDKDLYYAMRSANKESALRVVTEVVQKTPHADIIPSSLYLTAADVEFTTTGREWILETLLSAVKDQYDYAIIDSPPTLGILTINALTACTDVVVPMGADIYSLQGLSQLHDTILRVKQYCNDNIAISGLLITRYSSRSIISRETRDSIIEKATELQVHVFKTSIREGIAVKEAQTQQMPLVEYAPKSNPAKDYESFICEYLGQELFTNYREA